MEAFPFLHQILHTRRVDSLVIMWTQISARGSDPPDICYKNGAILRILSVPKYAIINLKNTILRIIIHNSKNYRHISHLYQSRLACLHERKYIQIFQGGLGGLPPVSRRFF